ncbi:SMI1/KNR4 family protein [Paenibacillus cellulositrophicus]|uniref:SMI1/KNR4 family protein n=1 Tax=Paenibacillus cellulositrophicus TaxID=562959 RepID=UPI003D99AB2C
MENLVGRVLNRFKSRLDDSNKILIQRSLGYSTWCHCEFYQPATMNEVDEFQENTGLYIPGDLRDFFMIHNGARLFVNSEVFDDPSWNIFTLEEITGAVEDYAIPSHQYPIAKYDDVLICIDNDCLKLQKGDYLYARSIYTPPDHDGEQLYLSFEIFLDRLIVSQGDHFWDWPKITSEIFYRNNK